MRNVSKYTLKTFAKDGSLLLYNTRTGAFVALPGERAGECDKLLSSINIASDASLADDLRKQGFLTEAGVDEMAQVRKRYLDFTSSEKELRLTLLPSENCNFRCPYCFIYDRRGISMKKEVYKAALAMIAGRISGAQSLAVNWFGGEPTLEKAGILAFMGEVRGLLCGRSGIKFSS
ncbi:MAG: 4Fe-4S cluster-binding domain-containing protein, partial [Elusimicrobiota bacterium]